MQSCGARPVSWNRQLLRVKGSQITLPLNPSPSFSFLFAFTSLLSTKKVLESPFSLQMNLLGLENCPFLNDQEAVLREREPLFLFISLFLPPMSQAVQPLPHVVFWELSWYQAQVQIALLGLRASV